MHRSRDLIFQRHQVPRQRGADARHLPHLGFRHLPNTIHNPTLLEKHADNQSCGGPQERSLLHQVSLDIQCSLYSNNHRDDPQLKATTGYEIWGGNKLVIFHLGKYTHIHSLSNRYGVDGHVA